MTAQATTKRSIAAWVVLIESAALLLVTGAWALPASVGARVPNWTAGASVVILIIELVTLMTIPGIRAVSVQTFRQCIRTRIGLAFIGVLAVSLAVLPLIMRGDGTLSGQIKTLLSYGTGIIAGLLALVTIFLGANIVANDIRSKHIFMTVTKPLPKWQYLLGRWMGLVMLNAVLLGLSATGLYGVSQYFRSRPAEINSEDRRVVETEVFKARGRVKPDPFGIDEQVQRRLSQLRQEGRLAEALEAWGMRSGGNAELAQKLLAEEVHKQVVESVSSVGPGGVLRWTFSNVETAGQSIEGKGTVTEIDRTNHVVWVRADKMLLRRVLLSSPVRVDGANGRVVAINDEEMAIQVYAGLYSLNLPNLMGRTVTLFADPTIQVTYKARATGEIPDDMLNGRWAVENPQTRAVHLEERGDVLNRPATLTVSAQVVSDEGKVVVQFQNVSPGSVRISPDEISVLYPAGSFEWNYVRAILLMLLMLVFLAALSVCAGSFVSFPVACMICFTLLPYAMARSFLTDAVKIPASGEVDGLTLIGHYILQFMTVLLPDFSQSLPGDTLVDGLKISWLFVGQTAAVTIAMRTLIVMAIGCLVLRKRELARVQV